MLLSGIEAVRRTVDQYTSRWSRTSSAFTAASASEPLADKVTVAPVTMPRDMMPSRLLAFILRLPDSS